MNNNKSKATMENMIYSSNSNNAVLRDCGPFKIFISDKAIKGLKTFEYKQATKQITVGEQIKVDTKQIKTEQKKVSL
ncbi:MAG: hypothetical protein HYZ34_02875 [Ignavibacteriae bacterium]|nr:hypothetical protein [Ignavibacteriota bacterium]